MIVYLDSSVLLAELLSERRRPPVNLWAESLMSSRLLEYEVWNRLHALGAGSSHGLAASNLIGRLDLVELSAVVLDRALHPFPVAVRTLDAPHLATYDHRMAECATALGLSPFPLPP